MLNSHIPSPLLHCSPYEQKQTLSYSICALLNPHWRPSSPEPGVVTSHLPPLPSVASPANSPRTKLYGKGLGASYTPEPMPRGRRGWGPGWDGWRPVGTSHSVGALSWFADPALALWAFAAEFDNSALLCIRLTDFRNVGEPDRGRQNQERIICKITLRIPFRVSFEVFSESKIRIDFPVGTQEAPGTLLGRVNNSSFLLRKWC